MNKRAFVLISLCVGIAAFAGSGVLAYDIFASRRAASLSAQEAAREETVSAAARIDAELQQYELVIHTLAEEIGSNRLGEDGMIGQLTEILETHPGLSGVGLAFEPHTFSESRRLFAPGVLRQGQVLVPLRLEESFDYTDAGAGWYAVALQSGGAWHEPVWREDLQVTEVTYAAPIFRSGEAGEDEPIGVAYITTSSAHIERWINTLEAGKTGWGFVLSQGGRFVTHPSRQMMGSPLTVFEMPEIQQDEVLNSAAERMTRGERGMIDSVNLITGQASWLFFEPIPASGWSVGVTRIKDELPVLGATIRREVIWVSILMILALHALAVPVVSAGYQKIGVSALWILVIFSSLLFALGTTAIRVTGSMVSADAAGDATTIVDPSGLNSFLMSLGEEAGAAERPTTVHVPTGIFVQSMEFTSPRNLLVTGFVWQDLPVGAAADSARGVVFPDAVSSSLTEAYVRERDGVETVGSYFEVTLRQNLKLSRYPFDQDNLSIRLWPEDFSSNVMLVPDLASYTVTNPTSSPGFNADLVLSGWRIVATFFEYRVGDYNTDFGIPGSLGGDLRPELVFNVSVTRNLVDVLLSNGIPLAIVLLLLFAALMTATSDEAKSKAFGFNPSGIVRLCSALFFVVLLAHIQLRNTIKVQEIMFLEYFYFSVYLAILLVPLHAFLFWMARSRFWILEYENSLVIKLLYWPLLVGFQFMITAVFFY